MRRLTRHFGFRTIKTAIGAMIAILISQWLQLDYAANSGIIVILSVQATKKKSKDLALMRVGSTILALAIGTIVFTLFGYSAFSFGIYLLIFIPAAVALRFHDGIVPCSVLVTHLLSIKSVAPPALLNEMLQMLIGAGIGFILNVYIPSLEKKLIEDMKDIDQLMKALLMAMADCLRTKATSVDSSFYEALDKKIKEGYTRAWTELENRTTKGTSQFVHYMELRSFQYDILYQMRHSFERLYATYDHTLMAADLTETIAASLDGSDTSHNILKEIQEVRDCFRQSELPKTREEFENRATLYEYINDLELIKMGRTR